MSPTSQLRVVPCCHPFCPKFLGNDGYCIGHISCECAVCIKEREGWRQCYLSMKQHPDKLAKSTAPPLRTAKRPRVESKPSAPTRQPPRKCMDVTCTNQAEPGRDRCTDHRLCDVSRCFRPVEFSNGPYCFQHRLKGLPEKPAQCVVYCLTNPTTAKKYVGQTWNLDARIQQHRLAQTLGTRDFTVSVLASDLADQKQLDLEESFWIAFLQTTDPTKGYNRQVGRYNQEIAAELELVRAELVS